MESVRRPGQGYGSPAVTGHPGGDYPESKSSAMIDVSGQVRRADLMPSRVSARGVPRSVTNKSCVRDVLFGAARRRGRCRPPQARDHRNGVADLIEMTLARSRLILTFITTCPAHSASDVVSPHGTVAPCHGRPIGGCGEHWDNESTQYRRTAPRVRWRFPHGITRCHIASTSPLACDVDYCP